MLLVSDPAGHFTRTGTLKRSLVTSGDLCLIIRLAPSISPFFHHLTKYFPFLIIDSWRDSVEQCTSTCSGVQESKFTLRTNEICVPGALVSNTGKEYQKKIPRLRWIPEQSMHMKRPSFEEAQRGCFAEQSAQICGLRSYTDGE